MPTGMFDSFITRHWFSAEARAIWSDRATLQAWLDVETALARAEAELGLVPPQCAEVIAAKADAALFDLDRLASDIGFAQHPFVPVLTQYQELCGEPAAGYIHLGATTQNIFDTAVSLQMRQTHRLIVGHLEEALRTMAGLAGAHKSTVQAGRTHGQHALPMTFGFKVAGWMDELARDLDRIRSRVDDSFVAVLGGAIGTFAALKGRGRSVQDRMAELLGLKAATLPMRASYDRVANYAMALGMLAGTVEKIAADIVFMQRTEIGEVEEAFHMGKIGSSTMAHKRNPSTALMLISIARMLRARIPLCLEAMVRMDEGDSSATNVTDTLLPEAAIYAATAVEMLARLLGGLVVHADAMARNLSVTGGLIASEAVMMRLTEDMGRHHAHHLLYETAQTSVMRGVGFAEALKESDRLSHLAAAEIEALAAPENYTGESERIASLYAQTAAEKARR
jgi:3-carboxy-cis,cis-muconate cycloisomerase